MKYGTLVFSLICVVIYISLKLYVASTPTTADDHLPDHFKDMVLMCSSNDSKQILCDIPVN